MPKDLDQLANAKKQLLGIVTSLNLKLSQSENKSQSLKNTRLFYHTIYVGEETGILSKSDAETLKRSISKKFTKKSDVTAKNEVNQ